jgi:hypothetical protein
MVEEGVINDFSLKFPSLFSRFFPENEGLNRVNRMLHYKSGDNLSIFATFHTTILQQMEAIYAVVDMSGQECSDDLIQLLVEKIKRVGFRKAFFERKNPSDTVKGIVCYKLSKLENFVIYTHQIKQLERLTTQYYDEFEHAKIDIEIARTYISKNRTKIEARQVQQLLSAHSSLLEPYVLELGLIKNVKSRDSVLSALNSTMDNSEFHHISISPEEYEQKIFSLLNNFVPSDSMEKLFISVKMFIANIPESLQTEVIAAMRRAISSEAPQTVFAILFACHDFPICLRSASVLLSKVDDVARELEPVILFPATIAGVISLAKDEPKIQLDNFVSLSLNDSTKTICAHLSNNRVPQLLSPKISVISEVLQNKHMTPEMKSFLAKHEEIFLLLINVGFSLTDILALNRENIDICARDELLPLILSKQNNTVEKISILINNKMFLSLIQNNRDYIQHTDSLYDYYAFLVKKSRQYSIAETELIKLLQHTSIDDSVRFFDRLATTKINKLSLRLAKFILEESLANDDLFPELLEDEQFLLLAEQEIIVTYQETHNL